MSRRSILEAEFQRNAASRQELCDKLLERYLTSTFVVLDFGCGPGFLAKAASAKVHRVIASDVSRGVIACARMLNGADNVDYVVNSYSGLENVARASIDLVYSFAVFQHLLKTQAALFFAEFSRVLKPGACGVCHVILKEADESRAPDDSQGNWVRQRVNLRMVYYTPGELIALAQEAGLRDITVTPVASLADMDDDIGNEHLLTFSR
jgi:cyclopropane fatty-acyl-phospholipid synthase-like methyltransferase